MTATDAAVEDERDALAERVFTAVLGFTDLYLIYLGDKLGLYRALGAGGSLTPAELAHATGTNERYVREWLEHQAVGGFLRAEDDARDGASRRYVLPAGHAETLLDRDSSAYMAAFARMMVGMVSPLQALVDAFRTGGGVPYAAYGEDFCEGQGDMNRVQFLNFLGSEWLPSVPDVHERLQAGARVADVACGVGWSTIALARAYPNATVDGIDLDEASIESARRNLDGSGVGDRVRFDVRDAADPELEGQYDLVTVFEALHDMSQPVAALRAMRGLLADGGSLLVVDERVADTFTAPGDEVERIMFGWSVLHCLPSSMVDPGSAATGTVLRTSTLEDYAREAGFGEVEVLPIENDFWRFYRLR